MVEKRTISNLRANVTVIHDSMFPLYVIRTGQNLLIDCSILAKAHEIEGRLTDLLGKEKIDMVLLTHSHYDHTGACSFLQGKHGFEIIASLRTKEILENDKAIAFIDNLNQKFKNILNDRSGTVFSRPQNVHGVREGDIIELAAGQSVEVFETPGHTRCSISFLLRPENILFPGDATGVMEKNGKIKPLFLSSYIQYERSLKKLATLEAEVLALPHNNAVKGKARVRDYLSRSLDKTQKFKSEIEAALHISNDFNSIAEDILNREFALPTIAGPKEALLINVTAMVKSIFYEFVKLPE